METRFSLPVPPNRALGQNFLTDGNIISKIVNAADIKGGCVLEIGPGLGALSGPVIELAERYAGVEIDRRLFEILRERFCADNVLLINDDITKTDLDAISRFFSGKEMHVVANLPYYLTTPIVKRMLTCGLDIRSMTLMIQKEAAARFFARQGAKQYGPLSVYIGYAYEIARVAEVSKNCFTPKPDIDSVVIKLTKKPDRHITPEYAGVVESSFRMRRKTLFNNLAPRKGAKKELETALNCTGFAEKRAEELSPVDFARLTDIITDISNGG